MPFNNSADHVVTQFSAITGGANNTLNNVAPSLTSGVPLISQGNASQPIFGTAVVAGGGTGAVTLTNRGVLIGQGTSAIVATVAGTAGQVLQSGGAGANPAYSTATYPSTATGTGTILRADGTNWVATSATYPNTVAQGDVIYGSATNVISSLAKDTNATRYLSNTGASNSPAWAQVALTTGVSGILPIANGGTNASSMATSNGIVKYDGTRLVTSTANIDSSNRYINAAQPASQGYVFSTLTDATGDGTEFTVTYGQEAYDQTTNLNAGTGVFTCPIAGFYLVNFQVCLGDIGAAHTSGSLILDLASGFGSVSEVFTFNPFIISISGQATVNINSVFKMQASGTITGKISVTGGTKTVDVLGIVGGRSASFLNAVLLWGY
jgi:hypothetical protein